MRGELTTADAAARVEGEVSTEMETIWVAVAMWIYQLTVDEAHGRAATVAMTAAAR